jgi:hypothetical protein
MTMTWWRLAIGGCGLAAGAYGLVLMAQSGVANIAHAMGWLIGGVVAHDGVLAPATLIVATLATRVLPAWVRGPAALGLIVLGSLTLLAIPVLGRFGADPRNPTVLDRDYTAGWLAVAAITAGSVAIAAMIRRRSLGRKASAAEDEKL